MKYNMICRLCHSKNSFTEIITLSNFPKSAQFMPKPEEFEEDIPLDLNVVECNYCNLTQLTNDPVDYYKDVITAASMNDASKDILKKEFLPIIEEYNLKNTDVLEIGSGKGDFLTVLNELDLKSTGIENKNESVDFAKKRNLNVIKGYLLDDIKITKNFSFIVCNNFLEHQPNIKKFLNKSYDLLNKEGIIYISVPNLERIIEKSCFYEFVTDHLVYFTKNSLKLALEMNGFEI